MTYTLGITRYFSIPYQTQSPNSQRIFADVAVHRLVRPDGAACHPLRMLLNMLFKCLLQKQDDITGSDVCHSASFGMELHSQPMPRHAVWFAFLFQSRGHSQRLYVYTYLNGILTLGISWRLCMLQHADLPKGCSIKNPLTCGSISQIQRMRNNISLLLLGEL